MKNYDYASFCIFGAKTGYRMQSELRKVWCMDEKQLCDQQAGGIGQGSPSHHSPLGPQFGPVNLCLVPETQSLLPQLALSLPHSSHSHGEPTMCHVLSQARKRQISKAQQGRAQRGIDPDLEWRKSGRASWRRRHLSLHLQGSAQVGEVGMEVNGVWEVVATRR